MASARDIENARVRRVEGRSTVRQHVAVVDRRGRRADRRSSAVHRRRAIGVAHLGRRGKVLVAPHDADRRGEPVELPDKVEKLGAVARDAGVKAEPLRAENGVWPAVAKAHRGGAAVVLWQRAHVFERVGHVGLARFDVFQPRLAARSGARILMRERPRYRAPEQVGRGGDIARGGKFVGDPAQILVDANNGIGQHNGRGRAGRGRQREVAIKGAAGRGGKL